MIVTLQRIPIRSPRVRRASIVVMAILVAISVSACFSNSGVASRMKPNSDADAGWVFGSIGCTSANESMLQRALYYRAADSGDGADNRSYFVFVTSVGGFSALTASMFHTPMDFLDDHGTGTVFSARLRAGEYLIYRAMFGSAPGAGLASLTFAPAIRPVRFSVVAGHATYLGEFLSEEQLVRDKDGIPVHAGGRFVVANRLNRDSDVLHRKGKVPKDVPVIDGSAAFMSGADPVFRVATP
jgi:hypothetical protein